MRFTDFKDAYRKHFDQGKPGRDFIDWAKGEGMPIKMISLYMRYVEKGVELPAFTQSPAMKRHFLWAYWLYVFLLTWSIWQHFKYVGFPSSSLKIWLLQAAETNLESFDSNVFFPFPSSFIQAQAYVLLAIFLSFWFLQKSEKFQSTTSFFISFVMKGVALFLLFYFMFTTPFFPPIKNIISLFL